MSVVRVALPVLHGKRRFHFDKGRPWSILEHVLLEALVKEPSTAAELARRGDVPRRIVIEALIRLMRAGWVEMMERRSAVRFRATQNGVVAVAFDELPNAPRRLRRNMNFVIEQLNGTVFRGRELPYQHEHVVREREERETIAWIKRPEDTRFDEVRSLVEALFMDDEKFVSIDFSGERLMERWSLVTVRDNVPEGLPSRTPPVVVEAVKDAAKEALEAKESKRTILFTPKEGFVWSGPKPLQDHRVDLTERDLVLGGAEHRRVVWTAISRARHRIVIHSTFVSTERFVELLPILRSAANRGVVVDVLWGQAQSREGQASTQEAIRVIRKKLADEELNAIRLHAFSTGSHCKILLADDGHANRFSAWIGSCNWLSSPFQSFESSIRLRRPAIVADVVDQLAELSKEGRGHWSSLTVELAALSVNLRSTIQGPVKARAVARVIVGADHVELVRRARDESVDRMLVASHRLSGAGVSMVIAPAVAAANARGIDVRLFYNRSTPSFGANSAEAIARAGSAEGGLVQLVRKAGFHAKFLAWDDDSIAITSQNWLSADPPDMHPRQEVGVFLQAPGIATFVVDAFYSSLSGDDSNVDEPDGPMHY